MDAGRLQWVNRRDGQRPKDAAPGHPAQLQRAHGIKLLWGRAAGRCARPDCRMQLTAEATDYDPVVVIGDMAHVAGARDTGPRAEPELSSKKAERLREPDSAVQELPRPHRQEVCSNRAERLRKSTGPSELGVGFRCPSAAPLAHGLMLGLQGDHPIDLQPPMRPCRRILSTAPHSGWKVLTDPSAWRAVDRYDRRDRSRADDRRRYLRSADSSVSHRASQRVPGTRVSSYQPAERSALSVSPRRSYLGVVAPGCAGAGHHCPAGWMKRIPIAAP